MGGIYKIGLIAWLLDPSCTDTTWQTIIVYDRLLFRVPNVFTPNRDGVNDVFTITVNIPTKMQLLILNRWGNSVFQWKGKLNKGKNKLWNGSTPAGKFVDDGVYFYKIRFKELKQGKENHTYSGYVHVFR